MRIIDAINRLAKEVGYVYIFYYPKEGTRKIGVSNHPKRRFGQVQRDLPHKLYKEAVFPVFGPTTIEATLHRKYKRLRKPPKGAGEGSGSQEFFALNGAQTLYVFIVLAIKAAIVWAAPIAAIGLSVLGWAFITGRSEEAAQLLAYLISMV